MPVPASALRDREQAGFVGDHGELRADAPRQLGEALTSGAAVSADDLEPVAVALDEVERRVADRAGRAEDGDACGVTSAANSCASAP